MAATDVRATADAFLAGFLAELQTKQAAFLARRGRYWQGLSTHLAEPVQGVSLPPDATRRPTDQSEGWSDEGYTLPALMPFAVSVNTYNGPLGQGYEVALTFRYDGLRWRRTENVGPEAHRVAGWAGQDPAED